MATRAEDLRDPSGPGSAGAGRGGPGQGGSDGSAGLGASRAPGVFGEDGEFGERAALAADAEDSVCRREEFLLPPAPGSCRYPEVAYFAGNSLGLQPRAVRAALAAELDDWALHAVEGHHRAAHPWLPYHAELREDAAALVGAAPEETVVMNSLTVNLHLMMATFYRPAGERTRIVIEDHAFSSDSYAVRSQAVHHGLDPDETVVRLRPRPGEDCLRTEDIVDYLAREGHRVALVLLGGVNYLTGEFLDIPAVTAAGHAAGCVVGWDLAHAAGNVPLALHDWDVDFAAWCSYKYLNAGPGAVAGCFVHRRHVTDPELPRLAGWWSTEQATRFEMRPELVPVPTADAWQISNPPILAMAPVRVSLRMFAETGMAALRERSLALTGYLERLLAEVVRDRPLEIVTPADPARRGAQLSLRVIGGTDVADAADAAAVAARLHETHGVLADVRRPDVIRLAPVPMYSTFHDCWRAAAALAEEVNPV
ncbi:kynureninase [Streptosporangium sp. CA-115845]|uniref:kynureninase n=1 Tax=Streptosporangium sp. CA-115845 TaxID=3240071 RepID=UPI003D9112A9